MTEITLALLLFADASTPKPVAGARRCQVAGAVAPLRPAADGPSGVVAYGLSTRPLAAWYACRLEAASESQPELVELLELRERRHILAGPCTV